MTGNIIIVMTIAEASTSQRPEGTSSNSSSTYYTLLSSPSDITYYNIHNVPLSLSHCRGFITLTGRLRNL